MEKALDLTSTQKKIIDAAIKVFSDKGFEGATTSEIAQEAGVAEGTIFRHFGTKKGILHGILLRVVANFQGPEILVALTEMIERGDSSFKMHTIKGQLESVMQHLPLLKLLFYEAQFHSDVQETMADKIARPILDHIKEPIVKRQSSGEYRNFDAYLMAISLFASLWGYLAWRQIAPEQGNIDEEKALAQVLDIWLYGVVNQQDS